MRECFWLFSTGPQPTFQTTRNKILRTPHSSKNKGKLYAVAVNHCLRDVGEKGRQCQDKEVKVERGKEEGIGKMETCGG